MKRISAAVAVLAVAIAATPAAADRGAGPGTTFPEQPGSHPSTACSAIGSNPGATTAPRSDRAAQITTGNFADACFGG
jgi:hypothetical protein